jgi:Gly-Xaa carboxypeptidase
MLPFLDTKVYHSLSRSVFRFVGNPSNLGGNAHTVDEHTAIDGHLGIVRWIWSIVLNADEYDGEQ